MSLPKTTDKKEVYFKKRKQAVRMLADVGMTGLLPLLMAYSLIGEAVHEWMGIFMLLLFILHHALNFSWYRNLFRGHYSVSRILKTISALFLIPVMLALPVSGIMMSRHIFPGLGNSLSLVRTVHLFASYWGFVLMSLHIGLHWRMAVGMAGNLCGRKKMGRTGILLLRIAFRLIALYGVYAFVRRQIGSYMFLQNQFVFFDFGEPRIFFFMDYLAVMCLFAVCGYYAVGGVALLEKRRKRA